MTFYIHCVFFILFFWGMGKRFHKLLGKLFLSSAALCWMSCDSTSTGAEETIPSSSSAPSKDFIDIEAELSKLKRPDTTGLLGKCISESSHCSTIENFYATYSDQNDAERIASKKIEKLLQSEKASSFSLEKLKCYEDMIGYSEMPDYGVPWCSSPNREKKTDDFCEAGEVRIDQEYIDAIINNDLSKRELYQSIFEGINHDAAECDALE